MPIYEYRCNDCAAQHEFLQKITDTPLAICPSCQSNNFHKMISASGFQLKGNGWYVTDFKNSGAKPPNTGGES